MKNFSILFCLILPITLLSQKKDDSLTAKQKAILKAKEIGLALDLSEEQENQIALYLKKAIENRPTQPINRKELSPQERYEFRLARLEKQQDLNKQLQSILDKEQYAQWKNNQLYGRHKKVRKMKDKRGDLPKRKQHRHNHRG